MTRPNFFIIGAPKCGTTSLATWLSAHPQVFMSPIKEPHHFNHDMQHRIIRDRADYESLFDDAGGARRVGEASVWYLYSQSAVPNIEQYSPGALYILCVRNPADMAYSLYHQLLFSGSETAETFEQAWADGDARSNGEKVPRHALDPETLIYSRTCALGEQVERLLTHVPRERVFILALDEMVQRPRESFQEVQEFLGLDIDDTIPLQRENAAKVRRSDRLLRAMRAAGRIKRAIGMQKSLGILTTIDRVNRRQEAYPPMHEETRQLLLEAFADDIQRLEMATGRRFEAWRAD